MDEKIIDALEKEPSVGRAVLSGSLHNFIKVMFWYINRREFQFEWFHDKIIKALEDRVFGRAEKKNLVINVPPRFGKLIADETPVLTSEGWKRHGDLCVGDYVIGIDGKFKRVLAVSPKCEANCCVEFTDGDKIYCHENHEWLVYRRCFGKEVIRETNWLMRVRLEQGGREKKRGHRYTYQLPAFNGIEGVNKALPVAPYSLGAWLGDGTNTKPWITSDKNDRAIIEKMTKDGYENYKIYIHKTTGVYSYVFRGLADDLHKIGLCHWTRTAAKYIPDEYLTASEEQRLELLAGLLDTDGCLSLKENRYHFSTTEERLRDGFIALISTFGWRASVIKQEPCLSSGGVQGRKPCWTIGFNPDRYIPCQLERKQLHKFSKKRRIAFKSVTKGNFGKVGKCIQVEDGVYLVGKRLKPTHNSEICKMFCAWSYMVNPSGNCIYTSYSDDLATSFSKDIKDIITSPLFKKLTGISIKKDKSGADYWALANGGGFRAASMGGSLTGYGAGWSGEGYGGVLLIDDPVKASSVTSQAELQRYIDYYNNTLRSRLNNPKETPIIMIMQRLSIDDLTGYVMDVEKDDWEQIKLPALNEETGEALWESKFSKEELLKIKKYNKFVYYGQYEQEPIVLGGSVIKSEWFRFYDKLPEFQFMFVTSDTAQKKGEANDFTVICLWGVTFESKLYLVDMVRGKYDADELREQVKVCWNKWLKMRPIPYGFYMEDKASGIGVIQEMSKEGAIPIIPVTRNRYKKDDGTWASMDKFSRVMQAVPYIMNGWVYLPNNENDVISEQVLSECVAFKADLSHKHDDICFAGDTKIATLFGDKKIKDIKAGERIITPYGIGRVISARQTGIKKTITKFGLEATPNHKIFVTDKYERLDKVNDISKLDKLSMKGLLKWRYKLLLSSMESPIDLWGREGTIYLSQHTTLSGGVLKDCTLRFGSFIRERKFRKAGWFITKTTTLSIMTFLIWSVYRGSNILRSIRQTVINGLRAMSAKNTLMKSGNLQKNGTIVQREESGIVKTPENTLTVSEKQKSALCAEENIRRVEKQKSALNAETQNTIEKSGQDVKPVYNLTIEQDGVYYANGILVSNCDNLCDAVNIAFGADGVGSIYI